MNWRRCRQIDEIPYVGRQTFQCWKNTIMIDPRLEDFPARTFDKLRYGDTDRQGHINNAVFVTFLETGRVAAIHDPEGPLASPGCSFVIARVALDFRAELFWPGKVEIGTGVKAVGRSSVTFAQAIFQNGKCAAIAESVVVHVDGATHRSTPLGDAARARLDAMRIA
jgi:acyl-CoA thioester hydrolase